MSSSSSQSSKLSVTYINNVLERLKNKQTRESTKKNYLGIWRQLNKFWISLDTKLNISWEERTALFGAYLVDKGVQSSTLKSYFSAIKFILKQDGYQWDDKKALLSALVKGCQLENDTLKVRLPIQQGLLEMLLFEIERKYHKQPYLEYLYKAIFCLGYYGMLRVGELSLGDHTVKAKDVHLSYNLEKALVVLYTSKTHDQSDKPQKIRISTSERLRKRRFFCPIRQIDNYMRIRGQYIEDSEEFFVFADKSPVCPHHVRNTLRSLLDRLQLDSMLYDVHSFRIGRTCDLEKFGYSIEKIKILGRWKSNAVYKYLKTY